MHEIDAYRYWSLQGTTGNALVTKAAQFLATYPKANQARKREVLALVVSLIKAKCYEDGIQWAEMALSEQRFVGSIPEMPALLRPGDPPPPMPEPEPVPPPEMAPVPDPKTLEKKYNKKELAQKLAELQTQINDLKEQEKEAPED